MWRHVPPAGTPVMAREIFGALGSAITSNGSRHRTLADFAARFGVSHAFALGSGRAALWAILRALARLRPGRNVVAIPAYTCYSVPAAIVRAGLKVQPVEMDPETWDFDYAALEALPGERLLCIVSVHLFGLLADVPRARAIAAAKGAFLVDDAAQALGSQLSGQWAGTLGDAGLYSLGRGKSLGAVEGGMAVTDSEAIARELGTEVAALPAAGLVHSAALAAQAAAGAALLRPSLYRIPNSMPFLRLGVTTYNPGFPLRQCSGLARGLFERLLLRLEQLNQVRGENAARLAGGLAGDARYQMPRQRANARPAFIRFPVLAQEPELRDRALRALLRAGIGASAYYPGAVGDIAGLEPHLAARGTQPVARSLACRLVTLPTHPFVSARDIRLMLGILKSV